MVAARTVPLWIPANAEIVIEDMRRRRGLHQLRPAPMAIGPGAVSRAPSAITPASTTPDRYPIVEVTAVTHRRAVYPTTVVGFPAGRLLSARPPSHLPPLLKTLIPDIEDYDLPMFGAFHNCAFVKIKKHYPMHARRVMHAIWGAGQMSWTKSIFVVDHDVDIHDAEAVLRAAARNFEPARDLERVRGPLDILDHAAATRRGTKFGLDCTHKIDGEQAGRPTSLPARAPNESPRSTLLALARSVSGVLDARLHADGWLLSIDSVRRATATALPGSRDPPRHPPAIPPWLHVPTITAPCRCRYCGRRPPLFHWLAHPMPAATPESSAAGRSMLLFDATPKCPAMTPTAARPRLARSSDGPGRHRARPAVASSADGSVCGRTCTARRTSTISVSSSADRPDGCLPPQAPTGRTRARARPGSCTSRLLPSPEPEHPSLVPCFHRTVGIGDQRVPLRSRTSARPDRTPTADRHQHERRRIQPLDPPVRSRDIRRRMPAQAYSSRSRSVSIRTHAVA